MTKPRDLATLGGGFTQSGTGAVQRTVESKLKDVVSSNDVQTGGGVFIVGTGGSTLRVCEISGYIQTTGTAGDLVLRFAQGAAVAADTTLKANSSLTLIS
jgi:hypothetical protein